MNVAEFQLIIINRLIVVFNSDSNGVKFVGFDYDVTFIGAMTRASKCSNWRRFWPPCWHSNPRVEAIDKIVDLGAEYTPNG